MHPAQEIIEKQIGGLVWHVRRDFLDQNLTAILENPDGFLARRARLLKRGSATTVGSAEGLVLKRFNPRSIVSKIKDLFRSSRAERAFWKARQLEQSGISTARPIAFAQRRRFGVESSSLLVMEEIPNATELGDWHSNKREIISRTAKLLSSLHESGFSHRDLKQTNIVFDANASPFLLDLDGLEHLKEVSFQRAASDLGRLARGVVEKMLSYSRTDQLRFLHDYCRQRNDADWKKWWKAIEQHALRYKSRGPTMALKAWAKATRKSSVSHRRLDIFYRHVGEHWVEQAVQYWDGTMKDLTLVPSSAFAVVHRKLMPSDQTVWYLKRFLTRNWQDRLKHLVRPSRGRRDLVWSERIRANGFFAPRILCLIEERIGWGVRESAVITEGIPNAPNMSLWLNDPKLRSSLSLEQKRRLIRAFGRLVGRWHQAGFYHGDLRLRNVLCQFEEEQLKFWWLDNESSRRFRRLPLRLRLKNLEQANMMRRGLTLSDRMRFWKEYVRAAQIPADREKLILRRVIDSTQIRWREKSWLTKPVAAARDLHPKPLRISDDDGAAVPRERQ